MEKADLKSYGRALLSLANDKKQQESFFNQAKIINYPS